MKTLAFDGRMGASGDMILGALLDCGADPGVLDRVEDALDVRYAIEDTVENGVSSTRVRVLRSSEETAGEDRAHRSHPTEEAAGEHADHGEHARHAEGSGPGRTYREVVDVVRSMGLDDAVEADAEAIFRTLGEAESRVHGTDLDATHFHEVGADDAIADVVGASLLLADLNPDRVVTTPLATGGGTVETSHGVYPVPAPAVAEIATGADWSLRGGPVEAELLTPTGAAILARVAEGRETPPSLNVEAVGYGAGGYEFARRPNVLRALVGEESESVSDRSNGEATSHGLVRDGITVLETVVDDVSPEVLGSLQETLPEAGARDVSILPTLMKKSRPGHLVRVVVEPDRAADVATRLVEETGTLGVWEAGTGHRWIADRRTEAATVDVDGSEYRVDVKVATGRGGRLFDVSAEFDDARAVAERTGASVREVMRRAENAVRDDPDRSRGDGD